MIPSHFKKGTGRDKTRYFISSLPSRTKKIEQKARELIQSARDFAAGYVNVAFFLFYYFFSNENSPAFTQIE